MTDEAITLPKSGIILGRSAEKGTHWRHYIGPFCIEMRDRGSGGGAMYPRWTFSTGGGWSFVHAREGVIERLDEAMLEAREALAPAGTRSRDAELGANVRKLAGEIGVAISGPGKLGTSWLAYRLSDPTMYGGDTLDKAVAQAAKAAGGST